MNRLFGFDGTIHLHKITQARVCQLKLQSQNDKLSEQYYLHCSYALRPQPKIQHQKSPTHDQTKWIQDYNFQACTGTKKASKTIGMAGLGQSEFYCFNIWIHRSLRDFLVSINLSKYSGAMRREPCFYLKCLPLANRYGQIAVIQLEAVSPLY